MATLTILHIDFLTQVSWDKIEHNFDRTYVLIFEHIQNGTVLNTTNLGQKQHNNLGTNQNS